MAVLGKGMSRIPKAESEDEWRKMEVSDEVRELRREEAT